jgi:hypothetical protein
MGLLYLYILRAYKFTEGSNLPAKLQTHNAEEVPGGKKFLCTACRAEMLGWLLVCGPLFSFTLTGPVCSLRATTAVN